MNACFYSAIAGLPLGTVAAIEFLPVIALAALGARTPRNLLALGIAVPGVYLLTDVRLAGAALGFVFAFANALLFAVYIVLADRVAKRPRLSGIDGLAAAMLVAAIVITPIGGWRAATAFAHPVLLLAGIGVGRVLVGRALRDRSAGDGAAPASHLRADGLAAAGAGHCDRRHRAGRRFPQRPRSPAWGSSIVGVALHREPQG